MGSADDDDDDERRGGRKSWEQPRLDEERRVRMRMTNPPRTVAQARLQRTCLECHFHVAAMHAVCDAGTQRGCSGLRPLMRPHGPS